jgi:hypothetical protein
VSLHFVVEKQAVQWDNGAHVGIVVDAAGDYPRIQSLDGTFVVKYVGELEPFDWGDREEDDGLVRG